MLAQLLNPLCTDHYPIVFHVSSITDATIDSKSLQRFMDGKHYAIKDELRKYMENNALFQLRYDLSMDEYRALTLVSMLCMFSCRTNRQKRAFAMLSHPIIQKQLIELDAEVGFAISMYTIRSMHLLL